MTLPLPPGWSAADFSSWVDPILADCARERVEWIYARTPQELLLNVAQWLATGTTVAPLPIAWTMAEFAAWVTALIAGADAAYSEDVLSKIPWTLIDATNSYIDAAAPADQWASAVAGNGGTVSPARKSIVQSFIAAEIAAGTWALTDDYWCLWAENPVQALTSIKQRRLGVAVNAPVFLPNRHYTFDGTTQYIDTGFIPSTHAVALTTINGRLAVYERANITSNGIALGAEAVLNSVSLVPRNALFKYQGRMLSGALISSVVSVADSRGWASFYTTGPETGWYKNGTLVETVTNTLAATSPPTVTLALGARNSSGTFNAWRASPLGFACIGASLSAQQELDQFNNVQGWAFAVGAAAVGQDEVTLWANAVIGNGGTVSSQRRALVGNFINALKASGTWDLIDDAWLLVAENPVQALTSLKQRRLAVAVNAPVFTLDRGYAFNGATQYLDTGFAPFTHAVAMTGTDLALGVYERTNVAAARRAAGSYDSSSRSLYIVPRTATDTYDASANGIGAGGTTADSRGLTAVYRAGANVCVSTNGVNVLTTSPTVGTTLPTSNIYIGALSQFNVISTPRASTIGFAVAGKSGIALSVPFYNAVQSFMLGAGAAITSDPDVQLWANAVLANGGTVSTARIDLVTAFVQAEKAAGTWQLTDDYFPLWGENAAQGLTSLKQRRLAVAVAAPVFTADRGYAVDGVASYINTGFIGTTHGVNLTGTAARVAIYERTNVASNGVSFGVESGAQITLNTRAAVNRLQSKLYSPTAVTGVVPITDSRGWTSVYLTTGPATGWYKNGAFVETVANTPTVFTAPSMAIYLGCRNQAGTANAFRPTSFGMAAIGGPLTAAQEAAQNVNVQAWATAIGANV